MTLLRGVVVPGHGVASGQAPGSPFPAGTIALQIPHFAARGVSLDGLWPGTLNVDVSPARYAVLDAPTKMDLVQWTDVHGPETFWLIPARVDVLDRILTPPSSSTAHRMDGTVDMASGDVAEVDGLIYYPHPSTKPHMNRQPDTVLELLLPRLSGVTNGARVQIRVDPAYLTLQ